MGHLRIQRLFGFQVIGNIEEGSGFGYQAIGRALRGLMPFGFQAIGSPEEGAGFGCPDTGSIVK